MECVNSFVCKTQNVIIWLFLMIASNSVFAQLDCATSRSIQSDNYERCAGSYSCDPNITASFLEVQTVLHVIESENFTVNFSDLEDIINMANDLLESGRWNINMNIQLKLATTNPCGEYTNGIDYVDGLSLFPNYDQGVFDDETRQLCNGYSYGNLRSSTLKEYTQWDPLQYFNVWLVNDIIQRNPILGTCNSFYGAYATWPWEFSCNPKLDGVIINIGKVINDPEYCNGVLSEACKKVFSDLLVHEFGHIVGLFHTFECQETSSCEFFDPILPCPRNSDPSNQGDLIPDTAPHNKNMCSGQSCDSDPTYNLNSYANIMSYCNEYSEEGFTSDQRNRVHCWLNRYPRNQWYNSYVNAPSLEITGQQNICNGENVTLTASDGYDEYLWYKEGLSTFIGVGQSIVVSPSITTTYKVKGAINYFLHSLCVTDPDNATHTVNVGNCGECTTPPQPDPTYPSWLDDLTIIGTTTPTLTWSSGLTDSYDVIIRNLSNQIIYRANCVGGLSHTVSAANYLGSQELSDGNQYWFTAQGNNSQDGDCKACEGPESVSALFEIDLNTGSDCNPPSSLYNGSPNQTSISLSWTIPVPTPSSYTLQYRKGSGSWMSITNISNNFYSLTGLDCNSSYSWKIVSICNGVPSNESYTRSFITDECTNVSNDECLSAIELSPNQYCFSMQGNIAGATESEPANDDCDGHESLLVQDVWYWFEAIAEEHTIQVDPFPDMDPVIEVRVGSCSGPIEDCRDSGGGEGGDEELVLSDLIIGQDYFIRIYDDTETGTAPGDTEFEICLLGEAINPNCPYPGDQGRTEDPETNSVVIHWDHTDPVPEYYGVGITFPGLPEIEAHTRDDEFLIIPALIECGEFYQYRVRSHCKNSNGDIVPGPWPSERSFTMDCHNNNSCNDPFQLFVVEECNSSTVVPGDLTGATNEGLPPINCFPYQSIWAWDVWYKFTATDNDVTIEVRPDPNGDLDVAVDLRDAPCSSGNSIACSDHGGGQGGAEIIYPNDISTNLVEGQEYYIRVYHSTESGYIPQDKDFTICVYNSNPYCETPDSEELSVSNRQETSARLNWEHPENASQYYLVYLREVGTEQWLVYYTDDDYKYVYDLDCETEYEWTVRSVCGEDFTDSTDVDEFRTACCFDCEDPTGASTDPASITQSSFEIDFNTVPGAENYDLEVQGVDVNYSYSTEIFSPDIIFPDEVSNDQLECGNTYRWRVEAECDCGSSDFTPWQEVTLLECTPDCEVPTNIVVDPIFTNNATVSWNPGSIITEEYAINYKKASAMSWFSDVTSGTSITLESLDCGSAYHVRVKAVCPGPDSEWSSTAQFNTSACVDLCPEIIDVQVSDIAETTATLSWGIENGIATEPFTIKLRGSGGEFWEYFIEEEPPLVLTDLDCMTDYEVSVLPPCDGGYREWSDTIPFSTTDCVIECPVILSYSTEVLGANSTQFSWETSSPLDPDIQDLFYVIRQAEAGTNQWQTDSTYVSYFIATGLACSTAYDWQVELVCDGVAGGWIPVQTFTTSNTSSELYLLEFSCFPADTGILTQMYTDASGCDSVIHTYTQLIDSYEVYMEDTTCVIGDTGTVTLTLSSEEGCDSIITVHTILGSCTSECETPFGPFADDRTSNSVQLSWSNSVSLPSSDPEFFNEVYYRPTGSMEWLIDTSYFSFISLIDLECETEYEWQVRLHCPDVVTEFLGPQLFTTDSCIICELAATPATYDITVNSARLDIDSSLLPDLFFSEYIEGFSFNKALEIYNPTSSAVDLGSYRVTAYNNGSTIPTNFFDLPGGTFLDPYDVYVIANESASEIPAIVIDTTSLVAFYNGDDAIELVNTSTNTILDIIGVIGEDPGTSWPVGPGSTYNSRLVRKSNVEQGTINWSESSVTWNVFDANTFETLGSHTAENGLHSGPGLFNYRWRPAGSGNWDNFATDSNGLVIENLECGTLYEWQLARVCSQDDFSDWSDVVTFRTNDCIICDRQADSLALVSLYNQTNGQNWTFNSGWLIAPLDFWYGVTLNEYGCVECIDLDGLDNCNYLGVSGPPTGNNLSGVLPELNLPALEAIYLSGNENLTGNAPEFMQSTMLEKIYLDRCSLSGTLPGWNNLVNLDSVSIGFNDFEGVVPDYTNFNLSLLMINDCQLNGNVPEFQLPNLKIINLGNNQLEGSIPDFNALPSIEYIFLHNNDLTGTLPTFTEIQTVTALQFRDNNIVGTIPDYELPNLTVLSVSNNYLEGTLPEFNNSPNIEVLFVNDNDLHSLVPPYHQILPNLMGLNVSNNMMTFEDIVPYRAEIDTLVVTNVEYGEYWYAPQDSIGQRETIMIDEGAYFEIDLMVDDTMSSSIYTWFRNGVLDTVITGNNSFEFPAIQNEDEGVYTCEVTNDDAADLTLYSRPVTVIVIDTCSRLYPIELESCNPLDTGTVYQYHNGIDGCDSNIVVSTVLVDHYEVTIFEGTCDSSDIDTTVFTLTASSGCDSIVTEIVQWHPSYEIELFGNSCDPADTGTVIIEETTWWGCDSLVTIVTELWPSYDDVIVSNSCNPADTGTFVYPGSTIYGCDSIVTLFVNYIESAPIEFIAVDNVECSPFTLFDMNSVGQNLDFEWSTGSIESYISVTETGDYWLTVDYGNGCEVSDTIHIEVIPPPIAYFEYDTMGTTVEFTNLSENAEHISWDFGDGNFSEDSLVTHTYEELEYYIAQLVASNVCDTVVYMEAINFTTGIFGNAIQDLHIYPNPVRDLLNVEFSNAEGLDVELSMFNMRAQLVSLDGMIHSAGAGSYQIDVSGFSPGPYVLVVTINDHGVSRGFAIIVNR